MGLQGEHFIQYSHYWEFRTHSFIGNCAINPEYANFTGTNDVYQLPVFANPDWNIFVQSSGLL